MKFPFVALTPGRANALGATLGQECMRKNQVDWEKSVSSDVVLLLDLEGVKAVNASFLKATLLWALQCGEAAVQERKASSSDEWAVRPLRLYPAITGCVGEVLSDVHEFFQGRRLPLLHIDEMAGGEIVAGRILGTLEPVIAATLPALASAEEATAADLAAKSEETISVNGWSNRLAELHRLRLATRRREGKFWVYTSTAARVTIWD